MTKRPKRVERPTNLGVSRLLAQNEKATSFVDSFRLWSGGVMFKLTIVLASEGIEQGVRPITVGFPTDNPDHLVDLRAKVDDRRSFRLPHSTGESGDVFWVQGGYNDGQAVWETDIWLGLLPKSSLEIELEWTPAGLSGREWIDLKKARGVVESGEVSQQS